MPAAYLLRRNNVYYYRRRIPSDCRAVFKKRELIISLRTTRRHQALRLLVDYNLWCESHFERVRRGEMIDLKSLTARISQFEEREIRNADGSIETIRRVDPELIKALKDAGFSPEQIAALIAEHLSKGSTSVHATSVANTTTSSISLTELIERYNAQRKIDHRNKTDWKPDSGNDIKFRRLKELLGEGREIHTIEREDARYILSHITRLPKQTSKIRSMHIRKVVEYYENDSTCERISTKQVNNHLSLYRYLFNHAINEKYYTGDNPFKDITVNVTKTEKTNSLRDIFSRDELSRIFSHSIFSDYKGYNKRTGKLKPYRYWTPLIGLYTGARPCEISSLHVKDIRKVNDVWVFDFNEDDFGKCSKSANAIRKTPIHPHLIKLGFFDFVSDLKQAGHARLFHDLNYEEVDGYGRFLNERLVESILKPLGIYKTNKKVFYSLRHTLTTELYRVGVKDLRREQIMGREAEDKTTGDKFYVKDDELPVLQQELEKVDFSKELVNVKPWASQ